MLNDFWLSPTLEKVGGKGEGKTKGRTKVGLNGSVLNKTVHEKKKKKTENQATQTFSS